MISKAEGTESTIIRKGNDHLHLLLVDDDGMAALAAAVEVAYEDPETVPDEYVLAGGELVEFFRSQHP